VTVGTDLCTPSTSITSARNRIYVLRSLRRALDPAKVAIVLVVGVASAALIC
jgi:hypothetical protein